MSKARLSPEDLQAVEHGDFDESAIVLGKSIGNVALAADLLATDSGVYPSDPDAIVDMLTVSKDQEAKSFKRYLKLKQGIGAKLDSAHADYLEHRKRSDRLFSKVTGEPIMRAGDGGGY